MMKSAALGAFTAAMLMAGSAAAQEAPGAPSGLGSPAVKVVGDWQVRCFPVESPNPCDLFQETVNQNTRQRILTVSLAYAPSNDRHLLQVTVPLEVALQKGMTLQAGGYTSPLLKFRVCTRQGCFVQIIADNAMINALAKGGTEGKLNIFAGDGKSVSLPVSLKGFSAAHDDMVSQARTKAKAAPAGGTAAATP
ncbi:MAG TPA: invasion associated locus B family protein [Rhizomicrobium sp.]|nr:invasion associated locus B family protein [Rhizomicrobium sp.]